MTAALFALGFVLGGTAATLSLLRVVTVATRRAADARTEAAMWKALHRDALIKWCETQVAADEWRDIADWTKEEETS